MCDVYWIALNSAILVVLCFEGANDNKSYYNVKPFRCGFVDIHQEEVRGWG